MSRKTNSGTAPTELGTEKISKLLAKYAIPGIIAMTASSLYNMVDSIFIGHIEGVGALAISALGVTFPLMNLSTAFGTLVGVGSSTMISVLLGQKNYENANKVLRNTVTLNTIIGLLFMGVVLAFLEPILRFFGASDATMPYAMEYTTIILIGNVVTHLYFGLNTLIRASGNPKTAMGLTIFTVTSNAIIDPIFIFGLGMGIKGAAVATVLCQLMALCYTIWSFSRKNNLLHFGKKVFELEWDIAKASLSIGMGPFLMNAAACIVNLFINQQLGKYGGDLSIGAYGLANRLTFIFLMINMGLNQGMQPIAGFNFGARQYSRVKEVFWSTTKWMTLVTLLCFIVSEFLPEPAIRIFTDDPELVSRSVAGIRLMNMAILVVGFGMASGNLFQCLGMVKTSIFLSLTRQLLFLVPLLYVLPLFFGEKGVWYSFPISDVVSTFVAVYFVGRLFRKFGKMKDGDDPSILGGAIK